MSPKIDVVEHSNFRSIIVSGAIGINGQNSIEITLFSNEMNGIKKFLKVLVHLYIKYRNIIRYT
jgi:hypothetical protein